MTNKISLNFSDALITKYQDLINSKITESLQKIEFIIGKNLDVDIFVTSKPSSDKALKGYVFGYAPSSKVIMLYLDTTDEETLLSAIQSNLGRALAHELHHTLRWSGPGYGTTLFEALVSEGLAEHFELEVFPNSKPNPWNMVLDGINLENFKEKLKKDLNNTNYKHDTWFFGTDESNIPNNFGYSFGYKLVDQYLKSNPLTKPSALVNTPHTEFTNSLNSIL